MPEAGTEFLEEFGQIPSQEFCLRREYFFQEETA